MKKVYLFFGLAILAVLVLACFFSAREEKQVEVITISDKMQEARAKINSNRSDGEQRQIIPGSVRNEKRNWGTGSSADADADLDELLNLLESEAEEDLIKVMADAYSLSDKDKLKFAAAALEKIKSADFRLDALDKVDGLSTKHVLPVLQKAAADESPYVRANAIAALANFDFSREENLKTEIATEEEIIDGEIAGEDQDEKQKLQDLYDEFLTIEDKDALASLLVGALADPDEAVRAQAMEVMMQMDADIQYVALQAAMNSQYEEVQLEALRLMSTSYNKDNIELILDAMGSPLLGVADRATGLAEHLLGQHFESPAAAKQWWNDNKQNFGYDLEDIQREIPEPSIEQK